MFRLKFIQRCRDSHLGLALAAVAVWLGVELRCDAFVPSGNNASDSRWFTTANGFAGVAGDPITLTWGFAPDGTLTVDEINPQQPVTRAPSDLIASFDAEFGTGPGGDDLTERPWFTYFEQSFDRMSELMGVTYVYEPNDDGSSHGGASGQLGVRADVRIAGVPLDGASGTLAYNYFPNGGGGDMAFDTDDMAEFSGSGNGFRFLRNVIMHEAGHGLGLEHTFSSNANILMETSINTLIDGPQHDDLRGFHWMYGDAYEKGAGNDTSANATPLGALTPGGALAVGADGSGMVIQPNETDFVSISNENDPDFFSFTIAAPARIDALMTPRGANFLQDPTAFDTTSTSDLRLSVFDTDGLTVLADSASGPAGASESVADLALGPGTYFARVQSQSPAVGQVTQFYQLDLTSESLLLGDFNTDGVVDASDYTLWRDSEGQNVAAFSGADHNGSGVIDAGDYAVWVANFGDTAPSSAVSIPEPAALGSVALLLLLCMDGRADYLDG